MVYGSDAAFRSPHHEDAFLEQPSSFIVGTSGINALRFAAIIALV